MRLKSVWMHHQCLGYNYVKGTDPGGVDGWASCNILLKIIITNNTLSLFTNYLLMRTKSLYIANQISMLPCLSPYYLA